MATGRTIAPANNIELNKRIGFLIVSSLLFPLLRLTQSNFSVWALRYSYLRFVLLDARSPSGVP
jgi:hypothetical protein